MRNRGIGKQGVALVTFNLLMSFLGVVGVALLTMVHSRLNAILLEIDRLQAQYLAEAGQAQALHELSTGLDQFGGGRGNIPVTALGRGHYRVDQNPEAKTLTSIGMVNSVRRISVIRYE